MSRYNLRNMRSPEEGPSTRAGPSTSGGSGHIASDQWRGRPRAPRRGEGDVLDPEATSAPEPEPCTSNRRGRPGTHRGRNSPPHQSVFLQQSGETTRRGLPRQRMAWTTEMNEEVMRCYYRASQLGTLRVGYRDQMKNYFVSRYPELALLSTQRIADQRRAICANNLVNEIRREQLRAEVEVILRENQSPTADTEETLRLEEVVSGNAETGQIRENDPEQMASGEATTISGLRARVTQEFEKAMLEYEGNDPHCRPRLPRIPYSKKLIQITLEMNSVLQEKNWDEMSFTNIMDIIYGAAVAITKILGFELVNTGPSCKKPTFWEPAWKMRLDKKIEELRVHIGRLYQWVQGKSSRRLRNKVNALRTKFRLHSSREEVNDDVFACLDSLKQRLAVLVQRRARYMKSYRRKSDNKWFSRNEKGFYRRLDGGSSTHTVNAPDMNAIGEFWSSIWGTSNIHETTAAWIRGFENAVTVTTRMEEIVVTAEEIKEQLRRVKNWATPGRDGIFCYYLKKLTATHSGLAISFNKFLSNPASMPLHITHGVTVLIHKGGDSLQPSTYRPITCLPIIYKLLTAIIANRIETHCTNNSLFAEQQKGCERFAMGCKEQLLTDAVITGQAVHSNRNLFTAYIDFAKAFDSVPHSWILYLLKVYGVAEQVCEWLHIAMQRWRTSLQPLSGNISPTINIRRGIFQGDALSPLIFCLALNPLSYMLNQTGYGFTLKSQGVNLIRISHLLYMDDLKLYASSQCHLQQMLNVVQSFGETLHMNFGIEKCRTQALHRGQHVVVGFSLGIKDVPPMEEGDSYKYLGILQTRGTDHRAVRDMYEKEFIRRVKCLLKTGLNAGNIARAINTFAIPVLTYTFGVVKWSSTRLEALERQVRVLLTRSSCHHPRAAVERFLLPRKNGGRGLGNLVLRHDECVRDLQKYFIDKAETSAIKRAICEIDDGYTPLHLGRRRLDPVRMSTTNLMDSWRGKPLHGRYLAVAEDTEVDWDATFLWLKIGYLFPETEGFLVAMQDQVLATRNYLKYIVGAPLSDDCCRLCGTSPETIQHLVAGCPKLAPDDYVLRHNNVAKIVHQELAARLGLLNHGKCPYYMYEPASVLENEKARLYWDRSVLTDRTITHNRPDVVFVDKEAKTGYLIDVAVPACHNLSRTCTHKKAKYEELSQELMSLLHLKHVDVIPLVVSALGTVPVSLKPGLCRLGLKVKLVVELQKAAILGTCSLIRKTLGKK